MCMMYMDMYDMYDVYGCIWMYMMVVYMDVCVMYVLCVWMCMYVYVDVYRMCVWICVYRSIDGVSMRMGVLYALLCTIRGSHSFYMVITDSCAGDGYAPSGVLTRSLCGNIHTPSDRLDCLTTSD